MKLFSFVAPVGFSLLLLAGCAHIQSTPQTQLTEDERLNAIVREYSEAVKHLDAFSAPIFGIEEDLSKFGDYPSPAYYAREKGVVENAVNRLKAINAQNLSPEGRKTFRLFGDDVSVSLRGYSFPGELLSFNQMGNRLHSYLDESSESLTSFPFDSVKHYDDFVKRSEGFPAYVDAQIELLRRGVKERIVLSCVIARAALSTYRDGLEPAVEKNPFYRPIGFMPTAFSSSDRARLSRDFRLMIDSRILPGFRKFDRFYREEYLPHCRKSFGIGGMPRGKEWYAHEIEQATNLTLSPKQIHEIGLREVARISSEMRKVQATLGIKGSLKKFQTSLVRDPKYYFSSADELFSAFTQVKTEVEKKVPQFFNIIPKSEYRIVESSNPEDAAASYRGPTDQQPFGRFIVNTKNLRGVPKYRVTTLSLHESVPGHHFQIALQFEMKDRLSEYRRKIYFSSSFAEGWGLYAEYLGNEMGLFSDPLQQVGHLNDELFRAVRLVVDTGIHSLGWSHEKAAAYMSAHLASDAKDISNEVNRYSVWPGQALGYKLGQLKILELRRMAEKELGPKFDLRGFHTAVIGSGTVSLGVLEQQVQDWIQSLR